MRSLVLVALVLAVSAAGLSAQPYGGDIFSVTSSGYIYQTKPDGSSVATLTSLPGSLSSYGLALSFDNSTLLATRGANNQSAIFSFDTNAMAITTMYHTTLYSVREVLVNQDGNPVFTAQVLPSTSTLQYGLFELKPGGMVNTMMIGSGGLDAGLEVNMNTGNYIVGHASYGYGLYDVASTGMVTTLTTAAYNRYSITQDYTTGDIYTLAFSSVVVLRQGAMNGTLQTLTPATTSRYYAVDTDRASSSLTVLCSRYSSSIYRFDPVSKQVTNTICPSTIGTHYEMVFQGQRNIASALTATGKWNIYLNFPGDAGLPYVIGLSITGYRPPITLPDGRRLCITPDRLTPLALSGLLRPIFDPGPGKLDTSGRALATLNVQNLPKTGIPVWFLAMTIKNGVQTISDPYVIKLP